MTIARSEQVDIETTPYYHCVARCVRRAFLCGDDRLSGRNFDHRKAWILERMRLLSSVFAIDVCAYAVMSNHLHLVLRVLAEMAQAWTDAQVIARVRLLCPSCVEGIDSWPHNERQQLVATWRERLSSISWFMGRLSEHIARRANKEDECKGRFWEGRFRSQALLDEAALVTCMSYVDLNPVRAGLAQGLEDSSWTSIKQRLEEAARQMSKTKSNKAKGRRKSKASRGREPLEHPSLAPLYDDGQEKDHPALPFNLQDYVELLEWTALAAHEAMAGRPTSLPPSHLLARYGLRPQSWLESVQGVSSFGLFIGHPNKLEQVAARVGRRWLKGKRRSAPAYGGHGAGRPKSNAAA